MAANVKNRKSKRSASTPRGTGNTNMRSAGILMPITSLPSAFAIGDMGPAARAFAAFCHRSGQRYWQVLPLGPVTAGQQYSPYSTYSGMAGNIVLISPEILADEGLLQMSRVRAHEVGVGTQVNYKEAYSIKEALLDEAYNNYLAGRFVKMKNEFERFCQEENYWLQDYALFELLKLEHAGLPWYSWRPDFKTRKKATLSAFVKTHKGNLQRVKWRQFIFQRQWLALRRFCNDLGIGLFGDLSFYVSYDSADAWANREIFALDRTGKMKFVAGVPPDYFNSKGQLWGMPVFKWDILKRTGYAWWIERCLRNTQLFDLVRIDHFRAFADYWEVPAGHATAVRGRWRKGPGADFFHVLSKRGDIRNFVAEDLGDINDDVHRLREEFNIPGMKVLHFAFGQDMASSAYIPHNYHPDFVVYTGTHDNNTTRGWYRKDTTRRERQNIARYLGGEVSEDNIHLRLAELAYASVARMVMLPIQDVLGLDESARINTPATTAGNWLWRLPAQGINAATERRLRDWCRLYHRDGHTQSSSSKAKQI